jgi:hypothetical protein
MAKDLIAFADDADPGFGVYNETNDDSLSDGIGQSYPLIKYKGKVWSLQYKGKNHIITDPTTGYASPFIDVIILNGASTKSKAYFENWNEGTHDRPLCTSMDSVVPDEGVVAKQSETCGLCPRNEFKMNANGKNVRECSDYKRLSVLLLPAQTEKLLGFPLLEPVFLRVPGGSLLNLSEMDTQARLRGLKYYAFITRIDFDPKESYPKMQFTGVQKLTSAEKPTIEALRNDPRNAAIIGTRTQGGMKQIAPMPMDVLPAPAQVAAAQQVQQAPVVQPTAQADVAAKLAADREARIAAIRAKNVETTKSTVSMVPQAKPQGPVLDLQATVVTAAAAPASAPVVTGLIPATPAQAATAPAPQAPPPPATQAPVAPLETVSDTGEPEMADDAIDARLAAMDLSA